MRSKYTNGFALEIIHPLRTLISGRRAGEFVGVRLLALRSKSFAAGKKQPVAGSSSSIDESRAISLSQSIPSAATWQLTLF